MEKRFDGKSMVKVYNGKRDGKLGTKHNPAQLTVTAKARAKEIEKICKENGWVCEITVDSKQEEDINDLELLKHPVKTVKTKEKPGRNDPCPCGSGKKYKYCCMK